jgi:peptidoglycan-associated lipoprotein
VAKVEPAPSEPPKAEVKEEPAPLPPPPVAPPPPALEPLALADIYFDFDRFLIRSDARAELEANARRLKAENSRKFLIEGHCDERGTVDYNLVLGERRAQAVKQYLQDLGVRSSQIQITSYGKEKPFCTDHSEACWQSNRRAHFVLP